MKFDIKNKSTVFFIFNIVLLVVLISLSFPLYKFFSHITGYDRLTKISDNEFVQNSVIVNSNIKSSKIIDRIIDITFKAEVDSSLNWQFKSLQNTIKLKVGENNIVKFKGRNLSNRAITATADFFAIPEKILPYLIKTECFCFTEQTLKPGEIQIFSLVFFLDASLDQDADLDDLNELILTYKFSEYTG